MGSEEPRTRERPPNDTSSTCKSSRTRSRSPLPCHSSTDRYLPSHRSRSPRPPTAPRADREKYSPQKPPSSRNHGHPISNGAQTSWATRALEVSRGNPVAQSSYQLSENHRGKADKHEKSSARRRRDRERRNHTRTHSRRESNPPPETRSPAKGLSNATTPPVHSKTPLTLAKSTDPMQEFKPFFASTNGHIPYSYQLNHENCMALVIGPQENSHLKFLETHFPRLRFRIERMHLAALIWVELPAQKAVEGFVLSRFDEMMLEEAGRMLKVYSRIEKGVAIDVFAGRYFEGYYDGRSG